MKFNNAYEGVKKIFTAEILALIAAAATLITVLAAIGTIGASSVGGAVAGLGFTAIFAIAAAIIAVIGFIMQIIGVNKASLDETSFKIALYLIIGGIIVSLIGGFINNGTVKSIFNILGDVINLAITIYIIQGIKNLAAKLNNNEMIAKGDNLFKIILAIYVIMIIARIITLISGGTTASVIAVVFAIIAGILSIIQYVFYLLYLKSAKEMLA